MRRGRLVLAMLAGVLAGALAWHVAPAPAVQITQPGVSTIQGVPACGTSPNNHDIFTYNGANYCGSQGINISGAGIVNQFLCAATNGNCGSVFNGFIMSNNSNTSGGIFFAGSNAARFTYNQDLANAFYLTQPLSMNGDSVMSNAPRIAVKVGVQGMALGTASTVWDAVPFTKPITLDACVLTWRGWAGCSTFPTFNVGSIPLSAGACTGTFTASQSVAAAVSATATVGQAVTLTVPNIAANNCVAIQQAAAGVGCTNTDGAVHYSCTVKMQ